MSNRETALAILNDWVPNEALKAHMSQVEAGVKFYAAKFFDEGKIETDKSKEEIIEKWGLAALLHDADWEKHPDAHPAEIVKKLESEGWDSEIIQAIASHGNNGEAYGERFTKRQTWLDRVLFACDELSGFIHAYSLMRGGYDGMEVSGVKKKLKDKGFARGVNREDIYEGAKELGIDLDEHIGNLIGVMADISSKSQSPISK